MNQHSKTASPARLTVPVFSKGVTPHEYTFSPEIATADYAATKVATQFRLTISTARVVCHLAGLAVRS